MSTAPLVTSEAVRFLRDQHLDRIEQAVRAAPRGDLWWAPHEGALSLGTILRHLEGNVRQWILSGLAGAPDERVRASEFGAASSEDAEVLLARLRATVEAACEHIGGMSEADLEATRRIQGFEVSGVHAVLHVVEHFAWHTGQAVWIAKARAGAGHGIAFYDEDAINQARNRGPV